MPKWTYLTPDEKGWISADLMPDDGALCVVDVGDECFVGNFYSYDDDGWGWTMLDRQGDAADEIPGCEAVRWFEVDFPEDDNTPPESGGESD